MYLKIDSLPTLFKQELVVSSEGPSRQGSESILGDKTKLDVPNEGPLSGISAEGRIRILYYTRKNYELLKTGLNNVVLPILLIVVNNIEQVVEPESSPQSGVTMLNNIVDIIEQCGQHNIVQSCFQQPVTTYNFWPCNRPFS